jgi:hypothetical protein
MQIVPSGDSRDHSALLKNREQLVKHEQRPAFKQVVTVKDTAKLLEDVACEAKRLVDKFMVRMVYTLLRVAAAT